MPQPSARPTVRDVAQVAGVSKSLVSLAFKDPSKVSQNRLEKIQAAAQQLGYAPNFLAQSLAKDGAPFIGIILADLHNPLFAEIADSARAHLAASGHHCLIMSATLPEGETFSASQKTDTKLMQMLEDLHPKGLLVIGTIPDLTALPTQIPTVFASAFPQGLNFSSVRSSEQQGIALALGHLIEQKHRKICFVGGRDGTVSALRLEAFRDLATQQKIQAQVILTGSQEADGYAAGQELARQDNPPTAIVAVNDLTALGLMTALEEGGLAVPGDFALVGFDNTPFAKNPRISLSSIDTKNREVATTAAVLLLEQMDKGGADIQEILLPPQLLIRKSSRPSE